MGNNSSNQNKPKVVDTSHDDLTFLTEKNGYNVRKVPYDYHNYNRQNGIDYFEDKYSGNKLPYISNQTIFGTENNIISSENPKYVEFIVCEKNGTNKNNEIYAIHKNGQPYHHCGANCDCLREIFELNNKKIIAPNKSFAERIKSNELDYLLSPTSTESNYFYNGNLVSKTTNNPVNMYGGANNDTSPDGFSDSDQNNTTTSDNELSPTSSDPSFGVNKNNVTKNNVIKNNKLNKSKVISDDKLIFDSDKIEDDEDDEDDEELEGLDVGENMFSQSDIDTEDIYKMKKRIFESSNSRNTDDDSDNDDDSDSETTERVRKAMNRMNSRNKIFDTEDRTILDMKSSNNAIFRNSKKNNKW
ncbi:hypothetical protein QLL95_gp0864 [Cotonvirus japonicus]|uniref:Uncharacterized protein n=1 Tax=Cotonvirus japonicus TaxID=2811091 RepID=A0ABM7NSZ1_9VIRU|nr:hypothetical protein QLL95_gp0864 [Cotonvirus japonicus]BCS83259.1 hypothetical protein [Cotonvirus japonicus]